MAGIGETVKGLIPQGTSVALLILIGTVAVLMLVIVGIIGWVIYQKKKWNLQVEIKLPRSNGQSIYGEWGKGYFHSKRGVVYIKRPGFMQKAIPLKIFDPKRYLQGDKLLTVIQLTPLDYRPVLPESFLTHTVEWKDEKTGEITLVKEAIIDIKCDTGHSKAWQEAFDAASKQAYSLKSFVQQFQTPIAIAIVLVAVFVGIAALWTQMPS